MGQSSEWAIEMHNERIASDEQYAEDYNRAIDEALCQAWLEQEMENETRIEWFDDLRVAHDGFEEIDLPPAPQAFDETDDLPF